MIRMILILILISVGVSADALDREFFKTRIVKVLGNIGSGSGVIMNKKWILSAAHVCEAEPSVVLSLDGHLRRTITEYKYPDDDTVDVCLIKVEGYIPGIITKIAHRFSGQVGAEVFYSGFPLGKFTVRTGNITDDWYLPGTYLGLDELDVIPLQFINNWAQPGISGGGVFNKRGALVGIVSGIWYGKTMIVPLRYIRTFLGMD